MDVELASRNIDRLICQQAGERSGANAAPPLRKSDELKEQPAA